MIKLNYLIAVKNLLERNQNKYNKERDDVEKDKEDFFYWILRLLEHEMDRKYPHAPDTIWVNIWERESFGHGSNTFFVEEVVGEADAYFPHLPRNQFTKVIEETVELFNQIGKLSDGKFVAKVARKDRGIFMSVYVNFD